jgi:hypothetical protein
MVRYTFLESLSSSAKLLDASQGVLAAFGRAPLGLAAVCGESGDSGAFGLAPLFGGLGSPSGGHRGRSGLGSGLDSGHSTGLGRGLSSGLGRGLGRGALVQGVVMTKELRADGARSFVARQQWIIIHPEDFLHCDTDSPRHQSG